MLKNVLIFSETVKRCMELISRLTNDENTEQDTDVNVTRYRNITIILGCLAEKLAGPRSVSLLTYNTLTFITRNLDPDRPPPVILFREAFV